MNTFEVAVLRILIKRQQPLKLSTLVSGFPDDCEDSVLSAVSNLKLHGYLVLDDYQPNGFVSKTKIVSQSKEREVLIRSLQGMRSLQGLEPSLSLLCSLLAWSVP